jgi:endonuclease YncB( thermonuclease family)
MGLLVLHGVMRLDQFWPKGSSDADTSKVKPTRFTYDGVRTTVFDGAVVEGMGVRVPVMDRNGEVTVRYQGIDAPELHYQPRSSNGRRLDFRQYMGESATVALHRQLQSIAGKLDTITCEVRTQVDHPNEVFDVYGRFIGDVWVDGLNVNLWLVSQGWAFPSFYASMTPDEIRQIRRVSRDAANEKRHIWSIFSDELRFDSWLLYRRPSKEDVPKLRPSRDRGPITMPKVFRRLASGHASLAHAGPSAIASYLQTHATRDWWYPTSEFLEQGAAASEPHPLADITLGGRLSKRPDQLVFREQPSRLIDAHGRAVAPWLARG